MFLQKTKYTSEIGVIKFGAYVCVGPIQIVGDVTFANGAIARGPKVLFSKFRDQNRKFMKIEGSKVQFIQEIN
jgi:hypothetical protein